MEGMERAWARLKASVVKGREYETRALKHGSSDPDFKRDMDRVVSGLRNARKRQLETQCQTDLSDSRLSKLAKFTDGLPLASYEKIMHLTPRLVNVVTLAEALPVKGTGLKLPLDLHHIAAKCSNSYFAPKRFAAVQLAFAVPRCRVLVFHTGRLVGEFRPPSLPRIFHT